jgi:transposase
MILGLKITGRLVTSFVLLIPGADRPKDDGSRALDYFQALSSAEFRKFLDTIENNVPAELDIHLIMDNYATHKTAIIQSWPIKRPRIHVHFTPTAASWLNLVERWFAALTAQQIRRGSFRHNAQPEPFVWTKSADAILDSIARYCRRINDSAH